MFFDPNNKIVQLCSEGMNFEGDPEKARRLFQKAWDEATSSFERFIAAHYLARQQDSAAEKLEWDELALREALKVKNDDMKSAYPSLYLNIGKCYEDLRDFNKASENYQKALSCAGHLPDDGFGNMIKAGIINGIERVNK